MNINLDKMLRETTQFVNDKTSFTPQKTTLKIYSQNEWDILSELNQLDSQATSVYFPQKYKAYINGNSRFLLSDLFHQYYGNGLFCEYSIISLDDSIKGLCENSYDESRGFAMWMEYHVSREFGFLEQFQKRLKILEKKDSNLFNEYLNYEQKFGTNSLLETAGFKRTKKDFRSISNL